MTSNFRVFFAGAALASCLFCSAAGAQTSIAPISDKMTVVATALGKTETGEPVQTKEKEVLRDLDELIARLEKECENCKNGIKKNNPTKPMADSMIRSGTGGIGSLVDPGQSQKDWAKLSGRERDRILQSMSEGFPPEYRMVLERYYRRLAEEKTVKSTGDSTPTKALATPTAKP
jgi:hypothetical protein